MKLASRRVRAIWLSSALLTMTGYGYLEVAAVGNTPQPLRVLSKSLMAGWLKNISRRDATVRFRHVLFLRRTMAKIWRLMPVMSGSLRRMSIINARKKMVFVVSTKTLPYSARYFYDYAVMERLKIAMVPAEFGWSDVGSWDAVAQAQDGMKPAIV